MERDFLISKNMFCQRSAGGKHRADIQKTVCAYKDVLFLILTLMKITGTVGSVRFSGSAEVLRSQGHLKKKDRSRPSGYQLGQDAVLPE